MRRMASIAGKRPRQRSSTKASSPVFSTPDSPSLLPSIQRLLDNQTDKIKDAVKDLERKMESEMRQVDKKLTELTKAVNFNSENLETLQKEVIPQIQGKMKEESKLLQNEIDKLNAYICRENLVFFGLAKSENENIESVLAKFYVEKLKIPTKVVNNIEYQRAHRLPALTRPRPIKARFLRYKERETVLQNAKHLKGTAMYIAEDLPLRIRREGQPQLAALRTARSAGKLAYFSKLEQWKLLVDRVHLPVSDQKEFVERWGSQGKESSIATGRPFGRPSASATNKAGDSASGGMEVDGSGNN